MAMPLPSLLQPQRRATGRGDCDTFPLSCPSVPRRARPSAVCIPSVYEGQWRNGGHSAEHHTTRRLASMRSFELRRGPPGRAWGRKRWTAPVGVEAIGCFCPGVWGPRGRAATTPLSTCCARVPTPGPRWTRWKDRQTEAAGARTGGQLPGQERGLRCASNQWTAVADGEGKGR